MNNDFVIRENVNNNDLKNIEAIVSSTGFFSNDEIQIAVELVRERINKGIISGYHFLFLEIGEKTVAYSCYGLIPATQFSYDLYWIAVHKDFQNMGLGKILLEETEKEISKLGGRRIYVETSGREQYISTRKFYSACNYKEEAVLEDFYSPGDAKYLYLKTI